MDSTTSSDGLTTLLSLLPAELRMYIYRLSLPCVRHRKQRLRLDYVSDSRWMATSKAIFVDAAPLVFSKPMLFAYTDLRQGDNFKKYFDNLIKHIFAEDYDWVIELVRPMVENLAITIQTPVFPPETHFLSERLYRYFVELSTFSGLKHLRLSYGPQYIPSTLDESLMWMFEVHDNGGDFETTVDRGQLLTTVRQAGFHWRDEIPRGCEVSFKFDRASPPYQIGRVNGDGGAVVRNLEQVNLGLHELWQADNRIYQEARAKGITEWHNGYIMDGEFRILPREAGSQWPLEQEN